MSSGWNESPPKFFEQFKADALKTTPKTKPQQNIIQICDDVYYYWRSSTKTIIKAHSSDIWESSEIDAESPYEEWSLSKPLPFHATHLSIRKNPKELCLLWGPLGAAVVTFSKGKRTERIANCEVMGAVSYIMNPRLNIIQAKWHPSTIQTVVVILNNDNFIRCYSPDDPTTCLTATSAGPLNSVPFRSKRNSGNFDATIDFDFGPRLYEQDFWSVFLLKSSGTLSLLLMKFIGCTNRNVWEEEKIIAIDGELEDILELPTALSVGKIFPLLITIGGLGGTLYHTILLPLETDLSSSVNLEASLVTGDVVLFVKEVVILESEDQLTSIRIIPDPICSYRYACIHQEGVHLITVNFVAYLMKFLSSAGTASNLTNNTASTSVHLISKENDKIGDSVTASFSDSVPQKFVAITASGETLMFDIPKFSGSELVCSGTTSDSEDIPPKNQLALDPLESVTSILSRSLNQSYNASSDNHEEALFDSIRMIQKEYMNKHEQALKFLTGAASGLVDQVKELTQPLNRLQKGQPALRTQTEELAEKYEELNDIQMKLRKRFQLGMSKYNRSLLVISDEERKWATKIKDIELDLPQINDQVEVLCHLAHEWADANKEMQRTNTGKGIGNSPGSKISAMDLLNVKREVIQHQKILTELSQSIYEISENIYE